MRAGASTRRTPARWAASAFSFRPPIGSTWPVSVSSPVIATSSRTGRPVTSDISAVAIVIPALGPSFGIAPGRHVDVQVVGGEPVVGQVGVAAHVGQRGLRGLLHDVAELTGDRQLALAGHRGRLDEQHVAADRRPGQPGGHARLGRAPLDVGLEARAPEQLAHLRRGHRDLALVASPRRRCSATLRQAEPISRSRSRTPASRV